MNEYEYHLMLPFLTDVPAFCFGFEMGRLWERLQRGRPLTDMIHVENQEHAILMARRLGFAVSFSRVNGEWLTAEFARPQEGAEGGVL